MENRNITFSLPRHLIKKSKVLAVGLDQSLNRFMKELLEEKVQRETGYQKAMNRQTKFLQRGFELGTKGKINFHRENLYER